MSKINTTIVQNHIPIPSLLRLQPGRWKLHSAYSIRLFRRGVEQAGYLQHDGRWVQLYRRDA